MTRPAVFLDRDGTINAQVGYVNHLDRFRLLPGAAEAIGRLNRLNIPVIVVTNQAGPARGYFPPGLIDETHRLMERLLDAGGAHIDDIYYCPHLPGAKIPELDRVCDCRKPRTGMLLDAARKHGIDLSKSFVVGDRLNDVSFGQSVGAAGILVLTGYGKGEFKYGEGTVPDCVAKDLPEAVDWIVERMGLNDGSFRPIRLENLTEKVDPGFSGGRDVPDRTACDERNGKVFSDWCTLAERLNTFRREGKTIVFTNGCFDILHAGHVRYLERAAELGDLLVVGLNSDSSVRAIKGSRRPILPEDDRAELLSALRFVDFVALFDEETPMELIRTLRPHLLVKGADYTVREIAGAELVTGWGGRVELIPLLEGRGTSHIIDTIVKRYGNDSPCRNGEER